MKQENNNEVTLQAAEYVLGILDDAERARFADAMRDDAALTGEVVFWENRLADVGLKLPDVQPPPSVWRNIEMQTGVRSEHKKACARRVSRWVPWSAAASIAAIALLGLVFLAGQDHVLQNNHSQPLMQQAAVEKATPVRESGPDFQVMPETGFQPQGEAISWSSPKVQAKADTTATPDFVGKIQDYASSTGWQVAGFKARGALHVSATGKPYTRLWDPSTLELWLLPVNSWEEPISLGLLPAAGEREFRIAQHVASEFYTDYNKLAVSVEPPGGSKTGEPTGDILFITTLRRAPGR